MGMLEGFLVLKNRVTSCQIRTGAKTMSSRRPTPPVPPGAAFISIRQLRDRYGSVSQMWVNRKVKNDPKFPRPHYFGRLRFWRIADLEAYERASVTRVA
jgi:hypothetical protein